MKVIITLNNSEIEKFSKVSDTELNALLQEIRTEFDGKYYLSEEDFHIKKIFTKDIRQTLYKIYYDTGNNQFMWLILPKDWHWQFDTIFPKSMVMTFFIGLLNGRNKSIT